MDKIYSQTTLKVLNGATFEQYVAEKTKGQRLGQKGQIDVLSKTNKRIECKFFSRKRVGGKNCYGYSNGFKLNGKENLFLQLAKWCETFDYLAVGSGDFSTSDEPDFFMIIDNKKAYEWLKPRICANGDKKIRFNFEGKTKKCGGTKSRINTLLNNGFTL